MILYPPPIRRREGFTLMEVLVVVAIILVLAAILVPTVVALQNRAHKATATKIIKDLCSTASLYAGENNDDLPQEDVKGSDSWAAAQDPQNAKAWYNALPKMMGRRNVADLATTPRAFYTKENILFLPGATYPESDRKLVKPLFAIGINNKLQRKDADGKKPPSSEFRSQIPPALRYFWSRDFRARRRPRRCRATRILTAPRRPAPLLPGRYGGKGIIGFVDGHAEEWLRQGSTHRDEHVPVPADRHHLDAHARGRSEQVIRPAIVT
jgi:prepilin-type N-terminal cleavage/methylation domain-containing protein/prepilin-type processing-associated H-X9-DG protein